MLRPDQDPPTAERKADSGGLVDRAELAPNALRRWARETPESVFLEHRDGRRITYRDAERDVLTWAAALGQAGIRRGEHVAYLLSDPLDAARVWLACGVGGHVCVPVNTAYFGRMLAHVLGNSDSVAVVVSADLADRVLPLLPELPEVRLVVVADGEAPAAGTSEVTVVGAASLFAGIGEAPEFPGPEPHELASVIYTSGTTGPSKGVLTPWAAMAGHWGWVPEDTIACGEGLFAPLPLFHVSGLGALQYATARGARFVTRDRFSGTEFWDDVRAAGAVAAGIAGPMTAILAARPPSPDDADTPLRGLILGPMIPETEAFEKRFGVRVATCYGMSEVPAVIATGWDHGPWQTSGTIRPGPLGAEARVVDENDMPLPCGEVGELVLRTAAPWTLNVGYHNNPEATVAAWRNGWFHTGDAFRQDEEGRFYFVDRMKDAIRRRGENISSFEVENFVLEHPSVGECAAFAVPAALGGDEVMIAVVPGEGHTVDPEALTEFLTGRMPGYMVPRYIDVVAELPRNTTSLRLQKHVLRERGVGGATWDREGGGRK
ncbi:AMP-binding protein [Yinghuangia sp. YIM S09857]|uniref:AMP-binding protein n=1 Tax=Yinghuangia sp. YIM S09857 TaxID=3436929 RepID=UPI003F5377F2